MSALTKQFNLATGQNLLARDRARARALLAGTAGTSSKDPSGINESITNQAVTYVASVGVGNPPTSYNLLIDTGSSNTWVGADKPFKSTSTTKETSNTVSVSYGSGSFSGKEYLDRVTLTPTLVIESQSIGVSDKAQGFQGVDGILGIGPTDLTAGTLSPDKSKPVPTVTDNAFQQASIATSAVGISFTPGDTGEITWGGPDTTQLTGDVNYVPITSTQPAGKYWGIDQSITYGDNTIILSSTAGIVDTGTTLILLATDAFNAYKKATGAALDNTTGLLRISADQYDQLQSLFFNIGGVSYELTANAQIWPRSKNSTIGGTEDNIYLVVADLGSNSGSGLDFINGYAFLERFYSVYDTTNKQVGIATTPFTDAETN